MIQHGKIVISGMEDGKRVQSRVLEERIQQAVLSGRLNIEVKAYGQHGIGGRLWNTNSKSVKVDIYGYPGQRIGSMGSPHTTIEVHGPGSDDVGWLNAGARIIVHGAATNGVANAMAEGKVYIAGDIGARGMTMTKSNPHFTPPELWVLGGVGDSFAEFMAGGIAVICGCGSQYRKNILGQRPCVGMVGGKIFFRGTQKSFSEADAKLIRITDEEWNWLKENLKEFLKGIKKNEKYDLLITDRSQWQLLAARLPSEKLASKRISMGQFRSEVWEKELGKGGLIGDLTDIDRTPIPLIATGEMRRFIPLWENGKYLPPCQASCPTGIPVQQRWAHIRKGAVDEAVDLSLRYTPFPTTVCGYLCPNLCMENCTRGRNNMAPIDTVLLGKASLNAKEPKPLAPTGRKVAILGGGPAGLSVAWQLWLKGHEPVVFDKAHDLGGKIRSVIPFSRIPKEVFEHELKRVIEKIKREYIGPEGITEELFMDIHDRYEYIVVAVGAQNPRELKIKGYDKAISALDFLRCAKDDNIEVGKHVVIIGAGNVGCDAATEASRLGAKDITLIDVQKPASFGKERQAAEAVGAKFKWPVSAEAITKKGVVLSTGEILPADIVIISIGDKPDLGFLPATIDTEAGFIKVNESFQTSDPQVFAIGDNVKQGLITDAIGAGRRVAGTIDTFIRGMEEEYDQLPAINPARVKLEYYDPAIKDFPDIQVCSIQCASCGGCRDCGLCESLCPQQAISRRSLQDDGYEYVVDEERCIGCGFCAGACPCGIWELKENYSIG
ncbi:MAG: FAD-dependent oxidoreductase [Desulfomonilia bacterium]|jgi:NADPH-dependent glutamate synthase beta subunit-like oxidoreductase/glutamate synthase domain-containing protein 3/NAD-dependent dihydropyrimidine dehydrogenase PreA subunit